MSTSVQVLQNYAIMDAPTTPPSTALNNLMHGWVRMKLDEMRSYWRACKGPRSSAQNNWTYIPPHPERDFYDADKRVEYGSRLDPQLYNLDQDLGQIENVALREPERVSAMDQRIAQISAKPSRSI